jgi:S1-C subfamily serine protease
MARRLAEQFRYPAFLLLGALLGAVVVILYLEMNPPAGTIDQRRIEQIAQEQIASATPTPPIPPQLYAAVRPAVVSITVDGVAANNNSFQGRGTGVIVDENGSILTSLHVIQGAQQVMVRFFDGTEVEARVTGTQPERDLAVIEVGRIPDGVQPAVLSGGVNVGDEVVAIGNPFGLDGSMSMGVVSGLGRRFVVQSTGQALENMIQFDAAVNPGNSGGPLVDMSGRVVGIVTGIANPFGQSAFIGLGFAVPIEAAAGLVAPVQ